MNREKVKSIDDFMKMRVNPVNFVNAYNTFSKKQIRLSERLKKVKQMKVTKLIYEIVCDLNKDYKTNSSSKKKKGGAELFTFTDNDNLFYLRNLNPPVTDTSLMNDMSYKQFTPQIVNTYSRM
jgi:hypothetical protein